MDCWDELRYFDSIPTTVSPRRHQALDLTSLLTDRTNAGKVVVTLRGGRKFFGILRSFDQFANLVLQDTYEKYFAVPEKVYGEEYRGTYIIRGENVELMGEVNLDEDLAALDYEEKHGVTVNGYKKVEFAEAKKLALKTMQKEAKEIKAKNELLMGI